MLERLEAVGRVAGGRLRDQHNQQNQRARNQLGHDLSPREQFDNVTLSDLQAGKITLTSSTITFTYGTSAISLNDGSSNLTVGYAFAIKTGLGRYVKVHVGDIITRGSDTAKRDLALEVYVYR